MVASACASPPCLARSRLLRLLRFSWSHPHALRRHARTGHGCCGCYSQVPRWLQSRLPFALLRAGVRREPEAWSKVCGRAHGCARRSDGRVVRGRELEPCGTGRRKAHGDRAEDGAGGVHRHALRLGSPRGRARRDAGRPDARRRSERQDPRGPERHAGVDSRPRHLGESLLRRRAGHARHRRRSAVRVQWLRVRVLHVQEVPPCASSTRPTCP